MRRSFKRLLVIFLIALALVYTVPAVTNLRDLIGDVQTNVGSGGGTVSSDSGAVRGVTVPAELVF